MVPFDSDELKGIVYVWVGKRADHKEAQIAEEIAYMMYKVRQHHAILIYFVYSLWILRLQKKKNVHSISLEKIDFHKAFEINFVSLLIDCT